MVAGSYGENWDLEQCPAGWVDTTGWAAPLQGSPRKVCGASRGHFIAFFALLIAWDDTGVDICVNAVHVCP